MSTIHLPMCIGAGITTERVRRLKIKVHRSRGDVVVCAEARFSRNRQAIRLVVTDGFLTSALDVSGRERPWPTPACSTWAGILDRAGANSVDPGDGRLLSGILTGAGPAARRAIGQLSGTAWAKAFLLLNAAGPSGDAARAVCGRFPALAGFVDGAGDLPAMPLPDGSFARRTPPEWLRDRDWACPAWSEFPARRQVLDAIARLPEAERPETEADWLALCALAARAVAFPSAPLTAAGGRWRLLLDLVESLAPPGMFLLDGHREAAADLAAGLLAPALGRADAPPARRPHPELPGIHAWLVQGSSGFWSTAEARNAFLKPVAASLLWDGEDLPGIASKLSAIAEARPGSSQSRSKRDADPIGGAAGRWAPFLPEGARTLPGLLADARVIAAAAASNPKAPAGLPIPVPPTPTPLPERSITEMTERKPISPRRADHPRVRFLADRWARKVQDALPSGEARTPLERRLARTADGAFRHLARIDPTSRKACLQRLCQWFCAGAFRMEDARRVRDTLGRFEADKARLPVERRDLNRHATPGDVEEALDALDGIRRSDPLAYAKVPPAAAAACTVMGSGRDWMVVRLDKHAASEHFADGTSWCTRHKGMFESHRKQGPLYVIVGPAGRIQAHPASGQVRDERDRSVSPASFARLDRRAVETTVAAIDRDLADLPRLRWMPGVRPRRAFPLPSGYLGVRAALESRGTEGLSRVMGGPGMVHGANGIAVMRPDGMWALTWNGSDAASTFTLHDPLRRSRSFGGDEILADPDGAEVVGLAFARNPGPPSVAVALGDRMPTLGALCSKLPLSVAHAIASLPTVEGRAAEALEALARRGRSLAKAMRAQPANAIGTAVTCRPGHPLAPLVARGLAHPRFAVALGKLACDGMASVLRDRLLHEQAVDPAVMGALAKAAASKHCLPALAKRYGCNPNEFISDLATVASSPNRAVLAPLYETISAHESVRSGSRGCVARDIGLLVRACLIHDALSGGPLDALLAIRPFLEPSPDAPCADPVRTLVEATLCRPAGLTLPPGEARDMLLARCGPGFARLAAGVAFDPDTRTLSRIPGSAATHADALEALRVPGSGPLLVALDSRDRDAALFEEAIRLGRGGALSALPPRLATPDLAGRLAGAGEVVPMVEPACASPELVRCVYAIPDADCPGIAAFADLAAVTSYVCGRVVPGRPSANPGDAPAPSHPETEAVLRLAAKENPVEATLDALSAEGHVDPLRLPVLLARAASLRPEILDAVPGLAGAMSVRQKARAVATDVGAVAHFRTEHLVPQVLAAVADALPKGTSPTLLGTRVATGHAGIASWSAAIARIGDPSALPKAEAASIASRHPVPRTRAGMRACLAMCEAGGSVFPTAPDGQDWPTRVELRFLAAFLCQAAGGILPGFLRRPRDKSRPVRRIYRPLRATDEIDGEFHLG